MSWWPWNWPVEVNAKPRVLQIITQRARYQVQIWVFGVQIYGDITPAAPLCVGLQPLMAQLQTTVKHGRINGGKLNSFLGLFVV